MSSFYKCSCGYTTKNSEYASFHRNDRGCKAVEYTSAFSGSGGLIAMIKHRKTSKFIKWYESEKLYEIPMTTSSFATRSTAIASSSSW